MDCGINLQSMFNMNFEKNKEVNVYVSLKEIYTGVTKKIKISKFKKCSDCNSKGYLSNGIEVCNRCNGNTTISNTQQLSNGIFNVYFHLVIIVIQKDLLLKKDNVLQNVTKIIW